ncbi:MAG: gamma-glutamylcyclotransferase family protein [Myxococcota bacterium]
MRALYFAYGSNLKATRMRERVPSASPVSTALLHGWRLTLDKRATDGSGKANLSRKAGASLWGFVYRIEPAEWTDLDRFEPGYTRTDVEVLAADGRRLSAQTYIASVAVAELVAFDWYKALIVEGAREHGLPADYVTTLEALAARPDPNA